MRRRRRRGIALSYLLQPELLWRIGCYGLLILMLASARASFFPSLRFLPASPDLLLGAAVAVSLLDSRRASLVFAMVAGFAADAIGGVGIPLTPLFYVAVSVVVGALGEKMLPRYGSYLVLMLPALLLRAVFSAVLFLLYGSTEEIGALLLVRLLPEALVTAGAALALYVFVKLFMLPFREKRRNGERR